MSMNIIEKFKNGFTRSELKTYETNHVILQELESCPNIMSELYKRREEALKRMLNAKEANQKFIEEGRLRELNDLLDLDSNVKQGIAMFKHIAQETSQSIDEQLQELNLNN